jgi:carbonic anhydrase/acetyltransferase-like protein (isoleucine patch superfamily)
MPLYELDGFRVETPADGDYWIAPNATVIGRVRLESAVSIWFGATVRGDNEPIRIGRRTSVQENSVLHVDPGFPLEIGEDCTIGHLAVLHGCTIGKGVLIGIGAIVLNGAWIGDGAMIGAGALVPPGREIPANAVVLGSPGKVVREVTDEERAFNAWGVEDYVAKGRLYRARLKVQDG